MDIQIFIAFIVYFCALLGIGLAFYAKAKSETGYLIGGRSVNYWVTAIATQSSDMGSWLFLAFPAAIYLRGIPEFWTAIGLVVFMYLNWQFVAPKLRQQTENYNSLTFTSYLNTRFNDKSGLIGMVSAIVTIIFFIFYVGSGLVGLGRLFQAAFLIDYHAGLIIGMAAALVFTLIGGFLAVSWCNLFQGIFLLIMIIFVPLYALYTIGDVNSVITAAQNKNISLSLFPTSGGWGQAILLAASWGLGYFGQPHILVNFMGIDDVKKISAAKYVGLCWQILVLSAAAAIGLIAMPFFANQTLENPEILFIVMTKQLFVPLVAGFVLCAILAATLSTISTQILISGTVLAEDIYKRIFHRDASSSMVVWISRLGIIGASVCALAIAWNNSNSVYDAVNYAWSGLGSAFSAVIVLALYSNKITRQGALAGIVIGSIVSGLWPYYNSSLMPLIPGFAMSLLAIIVVSAFTKNSKN
jgi:sodium/proline symporter